MYPQFNQTNPITPDLQSEVEIIKSDGFNIQAVLRRFNGDTDDILEARQRQFSQTIKEFQNKGRLTRVIHHENGDDLYIK